MFEKEAIRSFDELDDRGVGDDWSIEESYINGFSIGAEFGYNKSKEELNQNGLALQSDMDKTIEQNIALKKELKKSNEWHYVKDGDLPKEKGNYLVAWKRTHHVEEYGEWGFDVDLFNADEGYFEGDGDYVIAWKEITLPKEE